MAEATGPETRSGTDHPGRRRQLGVTAAAVVAAVMLGVAGGLGVYTLTYAEATSYLSNDPRACVNCHVMRDYYDAWQKASHHAHATCNDCHVPHDLIGKYWVKAEHGYRHSKGFTLQNFPEPIRMRESSRKVVEQNCRTCHAALVADIVEHGPQGTATACLRCHADAGHGPRR